MKQCLSPWYPDEKREDVRAGRVVYPEKDERIGDVNEPVGYPCYRCEHCTGTRKSRWAGKCLAEREVSVAANFVTCTYGTGHSHADKLVISDGQKWIKRIRAAGFPLSYLWVFEKGSQYRRSHIHALLFWHGKVPRFSQGEDGAGRNYNDQFWREDGKPIGMVHYKPLSVANIAYCLKYILPANDADAVERLFRKSTQPPLGQVYFNRLARTYVEQGIAPKNSIYTFSDVKIDHGRLKGQPRHFTMDDPLRDRFLNAFVRQWRELRPGEHMPESDYLQAHLDRQSRYAMTHELIHDLPAWINLRNTGNYYAPDSGLLVPGRMFSQPGVLGRDAGAAGVPDGCSASDYVRVQGRRDPSRGEPKRRKLKFRRRGGGDQS